MKRLVGVCSPTTQITAPASNIGAGGVLTYRTYLIVGNKQRVASTIQQLAQRAP